MSSSFELSVYKDRHDTPNKTQETPARTLVDDLLRFFVATILLLVLLDFVVALVVVVDVAVRGDVER